MKLNSKIIALYTGLIAFTFVAFFTLALISFKYPILLGLGILAYLLGLRHGVDADHILAIDNTTRKLMNEGQKPITSGLFFSLGHSTIVIIIVVIIVLVSQSAFYYFYGFKDTLGFIGTAISATFLFIMAIFNFYIMLQIYKEYKKSKSSKEKAKDIMPKGMLSSIFSKAFNTIHASWQMYLLAFSLD